MFCKKCGKELPADSKFCAFCGMTVGAGGEAVEKKTSTDGLPKTPTARRRLPTWVGCLILVALVVIIGAVIGVCTRDNEGPAMTFETIGTEGGTVFITLVSPSPDEVSAQDLANRLKKDWKDETFPGIAAGHVSVMVFDNEEAPQEWLAVWERLATMSEAEWATHEAQIFPHFIAQYWRNTATGLHEVEFYSRDVDRDVVQTIEF